MNKTDFFNASSCFHSSTRPLLLPSAPPRTHFLKENFKIDKYSSDVWRDTFPKIIRPHLQLMETQPDSYFWDFAGNL